MKALVCGGRHFDDKPLLYAVLDRIRKEEGITSIIHGGARGADKLAGYWAADRKVPCEIYRADWVTWGNSAGPIRNQRMLEEGKPELVLAFPGGTGTADMIRRALQAGVRVRTGETL